MTTRDPDDLRDPRLDAAWRAASREEPPSALDDAIRAAARREVGAGPQGPRRIPEALRPERWWWPLAAAATIGAVAIGLLQLAPPDKIGAPADDKAAATDMPTAGAPATKQLGQAAREETPTPLRHEPAKPLAAAASAAPESPGNAQRDRAASPANPNPPASSVASGLRKDAIPGTPKERASTTAPAASPPPSAPAPTEVQKGRQTGAESDTPTQHVAEPFPADVVKRESKEELAAGGTSPAPNRDELGAAAATGKLGATPAPPAAAREAAGDAQRAPASVSQSSAPAPAMAARRAQQAEAPRANAAADAGAASFAETKPGARAKVHAKLPVADWIALIRKLRDEGRVDEAAKELAAFRAAHPDHERLLPPDLRDWRPATK